MSWEKHTIGDFIDVLSGYAFKTKDFVDKGIPVIKIKNINPPEVTLNDVSYVSTDFLTTHARFKLEYNDILISMTGSQVNHMSSIVGQTARVRFHDASLLNQRVGKIIAKENGIIDLDYIYYYLSQESLTLILANQATGSANQANISPQTIKNLVFLCPNLPAQHRIASILSAYDDLIENNRKQIKLLEEAAQRLYKEWFVDLRFPGHENVAVVDGVPEGWRKGRADDFFSITIGKTPPRS